MINFFLNFVIAVTYRCRPFHPKSAPNGQFIHFLALILTYLLGFQKIFGGIGLNMSVGAAIKYVSIKVFPFDRDSDQLAMMGNNYDASLVTQYNNMTGQLLIENVGPGNSTAAAWSAVINMPAYRLISDVSVLNSLQPNLISFSFQNAQPFSCFDYANNKYRRTFQLKVMNYDGKQSNSILRVLRIKTGSPYQTYDMSF